MSDILDKIEQIQTNVREIKSTWGNTIMMLDNIKSGLKADKQKVFDEAYQKGLDDGKDCHEQGCKGCLWEGQALSTYPCSICCNSYKNKYKREEDKIEVGDEVSAEDGTSIFIVTWMSERCICGVDKEGRCYSYEWSDICGKTGNHYDIVFKEMRG